MMWHFVGSTPIARFGMDYNLDILSSDVSGCMNLGRHYR